MRRRTSLLPEYTGPANPPPYQYPDDGMCSQIDPILWEMQEQGDQAIDARRACRLCPVLRECREAALEAAVGIDGTIRADMSERQFRKALSERRRERGLHPKTGTPLHLVKPNPATARRRAERERQQAEDVA